MSNIGPVPLFAVPSRSCRLRAWPADWLAMSAESGSAESERGKRERGKRDRSERGKRDRSDIDKLGVLGLT